MTDNDGQPTSATVGGREARGERNSLRFIPGRPGRNFLSKMGAAWNISLFHYRSHGADFGRVLVGVQVPPRDQKKFQRFLDRLGYEYVEETGNPAYQLFLG